MPVATRLYVRNDVEARPPLTPRQVLKGASFWRNDMPVIEEWVPVEGWPGYEISSEGRLGSRKKPDQLPLGSIRRILIGGCDKDGYKRAVLYGSGGRSRSVKIHHIVLTAFKGIKPVGFVGRHLNGDRKDNRSCNLEWSTQKDNIADKIIHGTSQIGERHGRSKITDEIALAIRAASGKQVEIARRFCVSRGIVYLVRSGVRWTHLLQRDSLDTDMKHPSAVIEDHTH